MPTTRQSPPLANAGKAGVGFLDACREARRKSRMELLTIAVARGCDHYATLWPALQSSDDASLPNEILGCALLRGAEDATTFQAIRCGAMILSDLNNSPRLIAAAAEHLHVVDRVAHIAKLGLAADEHPAFWREVIRELPNTRARAERFMPGVSRLAMETWMTGNGGGPARVWLRTAYKQ